MHKRWAWALYALALILAVSLSVRNARVPAQPEPGILLQAETETPQTGSHPAPIIAAMVMAFSGVGLSLLAEEKDKRK